MSSLSVGLDVSLKSVTAAFVLQDSSEPVRRFNFSNNPAGVEVLISKINKVASQHIINNIDIGMESTGNFGSQLMEMLRNHPELADIETNVHSLNARVISIFRKTISEDAKTDSIDAYVIAEYLRYKNLPKPILVDERYQALQKLTRHRYTLTHSLASEKSRFLSHLFLKFSAFRQEKPLQDAFGATASAIFTEFLCVEEIANMSMDDLITFIMEKSRNSFVDPEATAKAISEAAHNSYPLSKCIADPINVVLSMTLENIRFFEKQIKEIDKIIEKHLSAFKTQATILRSIPGLGPVFTAGIIAEIGGIERFESESSLAKYASFAWKRMQTGQYESQHTPMSKSGNQFLRYYLVEAANSLRMHCEEYSHYYQVKYRGAEKYKHKRACVLCARKLVRLIYNLLHKGMLYKSPEERKEMSAENTNQQQISHGELVRQITRRRQTKRARS